MARVKDSFVNLEKHRQQLEDHFEKLSSALDHWRQWKEEYENLRDDVKALPLSAARSSLTRTREEYEGDLVKEKELVDIFGRDDSRKRDQIISVLTNRLDYVAKNVDTLEKQLEIAQDKLGAATVVSNPEATDQDGLPITEILEELDDDDNVVSYKLRTPGDNHPQLLEALEKAGIKDLPAGARASLPEPTEDVDKPTASKQVGNPEVSEPNGSQAEEKKPKTVPKRKGVTFSEDTKTDEEEKKEREQNLGNRPSDTTQRLEEILRKAQDQQTMISEPILPADETPEDAELREDMIRYNKQTMEYEMAPIVAELQLEEGSAGDDFDTDDDSEYDDDEDEWGRSMSGVVDDDWKRQMLEIKERLSKHTFGEDKASDDDDDDDETGDGIGRISVKIEKPAGAQNGINHQPLDIQETKEPSPSTDTKKSVRFAQNLDIAEGAPLTPLPEQTPAQQPKQPEVEPLSDIVERTAGPAKPTPSTTKRPSRFRKARANDAPVPSPTLIAPEIPVDQSRYAPSGPEGKTLANSVLEREPSTDPKEPDEFDANLLQQQVAEEFYKSRNKMIQKQGGFMKEDENPIQPLDEEEGGPKRMSRFRVARLAKS